MQLKSYKQERGKLKSMQLKSYKQERGNVCN